MAKKSFTDQMGDFTEGLILDQSDITDTGNLTDTIVETLNETTQIDNGINYCSPDKFIPYSDEKLRLDLHNGEERERLKESILKNGIINPVICIPNEDKFEILSGHNRVDVCKELGIDVPYILKENLTKDESDLIVIDTNLLNRQRSDYKPSRFAYILKVKFEAEKQQNDNTKELTGEKVGSEYGLSRKTIHTYIKLNDLVDTAKEAVDNNQITIKTAFELAFLDGFVQKLIINLLDEYVVNEKNLHELRKNIDDKIFSSTDDKVTFIKSQLAEKTTKPRKFDYRKVKKYIPKELKDEEVEEFIIAAIKAYRGY